MTNHGYRVSLSQHSQTSKNESFEQYNSQSLASLSKGTMHLVGGDTSSPFVSPPYPDQCNIYSGGGGHRRRKSNTKGSGNNSASMRRKLNQPKKPKGRPRGSKNKPKPPMMDDEALRHVIIEISAGCDVVEELMKFAEIHDVGLTVLSGSGSVTNVTLSHTFFHAPSLTLHGTFTMLSLSGTYVKTDVSASSSSSSLPNPNPSFPVNVVVPPPGYSCFTICLAGAEGQIFGGVIAGRIIAASLVVVVAALHKKPMFHRVLNNNNETNTNNSLVVDLSDVDDSVLKGGTNNACLMALLASFNNAVNSSPLNSQAPNLPPS